MLIGDSFAEGYGVEIDKIFAQTVYKRCFIEVILNGEERGKDLVKFSKNGHTMEVLKLEYNYKDKSWENFLMY